MSVLDFIMEIVFILFVALMAMTGLLIAGALIAGLFFIVLAAGGWILNMIQARQGSP